MFKFILIFTCLVIFYFFTLGLSYAIGMNVTDVRISCLAGIVIGEMIDKIFDDK